MTDGPLSDLVVLDLTRYLSGPYCTLLLAGMGARVIKVDNPQTGDPTVGAPPFVGQHGATLEREIDSVGIAYLKRQRGKESTTIDLKHIDGQRLLKQLVSHVDVVVENFRPGVAERLGIGYETLSVINPRLVYCAITGYGQSGVDRDKKSYDLMAQAASGLMGITGEPDGRPLKAGGPMADTVAGTWGALSILAALQERHRSGKGQAIDVSMVDCLFSMMMDEPLDCYPQLGLDPRIGNRTMRFSPFNTYRTRDGWIAIGVVSERDWQQFARIIGRPELADDRQFADVAWRIRHHKRVDDVVNEWTSQLPSKVLLTQLDDADIACSQVKSPAEAIDSEHLHSRNMVQEVLAPGGTHTGVVGPDMPFRMNRSHIGHRYPAPQPGRHTESVLADLLGMDGDAITDLRRRGVI